MPNPFRVIGPTKIAFSGGRSSAYMLWRYLDAHGGQLPRDVHVVFANTGEEADGTLVFVRECGERWGVKIRWVEFMSAAPHFREVTFETAARKGEPYDGLVDWKRYVPNPTARICTVWLKAMPAAAFMKSIGYEPGDFSVEEPPDFDEAIGIRADEPKRVAKYRQYPWTILPMADAGVTKPDVAAFWASQPFDLQIPEGEGNCKLCFEKRLAQLINVAKSSPDEAGIDRWIDREQRIGAPFDKRWSYAQIRDTARRQLTVLAPKTDAESCAPNCACGE